MTSAPQQPDGSLRAPSFHYVAAGLSCIYALLVFFQLTIATGDFSSDLVLHRDFILHPYVSPAAGYSLLHVLCGWIVAGVGVTGVDATGVANGAMLVVLVAAFHGSLLAVHAYFKRAYPGRNEWLLGGCTLAAFLVAMLMPQPLIEGGPYIGIFTPNPWHNPTYLFGRFFSILAFCRFVRLLEPGERATARRLVSLAAFTALSVWGKPSFLLGFLPAALAVLVWEWLRHRLKPGQVFLLAATFVPAVLILAWINHKVYASGGVTDKVIFAPGKGWGVYAPSFTLAIALGMMFPLYVLMVRLRNLPVEMLTAAATWIASCGVFLLLAETGLRATHANFAWCYMSGMFFLHLSAIGNWFLGNPVGNRAVRWIGTALFLLHLLSGLRYFLRMLGGGSYM